MLFSSAFIDGSAATALTFGDRSWSYREFRGSVIALARQLRGVERAAVWCTPTAETCVGVLGALAAGTVAIPLNPKLGTHELEHVVADSAPDVVLAGPADELPAGLAPVKRIDVDTSAHMSGDPVDVPVETPALLVYTSGTTGPPKGVLLPYRAISSNLDALAEAWQWTPDDLLVHALPLFHVHGLVLGVLGPLRIGGSLHHPRMFSPSGIAAALSRGGTMLFGVPTMYHRLADAAEASRDIADALAKARLLISGSAPLPGREFARIEAATGQKIVERYGMTETLMNCAVRASGERRPRYVGPPLSGVDVRLVDDDMQPLEVCDDETIGEIEVRGPNLFVGYLNRPDATASAYHGDWFRTGDLATRAPDGYIRIVGRRSVDLIKTGGFKVGAGEIEGALLEHPAVREAAVTGEPDADLGERIVAWVVPAGPAVPSLDELADHVATLLASHKRPRQMHVLSSLPRNEMGKIMKSALAAARLR